MEPHLKGACQKCGGPLEFPAESSGASSQCPHCGQETRLKPGPVNFEDPIVSEALLPELPEAADEPSPWRKPIIKVAIVTAILAVVLVVLIVAAEWLSRLKRPHRENGQVPNTTQTQ